MNDQPSEGPTRGDAVRTYEVHALGPPGAGKTVFMASLYKRLNIKRSELPFYLKSEVAPWPRAPTPGPCRVWAAAPVTANAPPPLATTPVASPR